MVLRVGGLGNSIPYRSISQMLVLCLAILLLSALLFIVSFIQYSLMLVLLINI